jgi:hypothetical protein
LGIVGRVGDKVEDLLLGTVDKDAFFERKYGMFSCPLLEIGLGLIFWAAPPAQKVLPMSIEFVLPMSLEYSVTYLPDRFTLR